MDLYQDYFIKPAKKIVSRDKNNRAGIDNIRLGCMAVYIVNVLFESLIFPFEF